MKRTLVQNVSRLLNDLMKAYIDELINPKSDDPKFLQNLRISMDCLMIGVEKRNEVGE